MMLDDQDAKVIEQADEFLAWDRQPRDRTDEDVIRHYEDLMRDVDNGLLREVMRTVMNTRTVIGALRHRRRGHEPPAIDTEIGRHIARNWKHPEFRLSGRFPWLSQIDQLLNSDHPLDAEQALMHLTWDKCQQLAAQYLATPFSFEMLILYLIRWEVVYRWTIRDANKGQEKFEQLAKNAMGEYADMFG